MKILKSKRFLIILLLIIVLGGIGIFFYMRNNPASNLNQTTIPALIQKEVILGFDPNTLTASAGGKVNSDITVNAGDAGISYVMIDLSYDPKLFTNVTVTPFKDVNSAISASFLPEVITNDTQNGKISISYTLINGAIEQKGTAILAKFSATYKGGAGGTVTLTPNSIVATKSSVNNLQVGRVNLNVNP